jgi:hypothetical protein
VEGGIDYFGEFWGDDEHCPECGADPADALNPLYATSDAPDLEQWVSDHVPACKHCNDSWVEFIPADQRTPGMASFWWRCQVCDRWVDDEGNERDIDAEVARLRDQVERVREALDRSERWLNSQHPIFAAAVRREVNVIRSALDGEVRE